MRCQNCQTECPLDAPDCTHCGGRLKDSQAEPLVSPDAGNSHSNRPSLTAARSNIFAKHWHGEYSLGVSYWLIGGLLSVALGMLGITLGRGAATVDWNPRLNGVFIVAVYAVFFFVGVWQLVGIWRSAGQHRQRGGKRFWAALAQVMVILGALRIIGVYTTQGVPAMSEGLKLAAGVETTPPYELRLLRDGTEAELAGGMPFGTADAVRQILDQHPAVKVLHLNSDGGRIAEAFKLYQLIEQRRLITYTSATCASACSIAFLGGHERYLGQDGRLGFHSASFGDLSGTVAPGLNNSIREKLQEHGVPYGIIERALATSPDDMWYPSHEELKAANIISAVVDPHIYGLSGFRQWRDVNQLEAGLLTVPIFATMAEHDPANYVLLRDMLVAGVQRGDAMADTQNSVRKLLMEKVLPTYLQKAPDQLLIRYWRTQIEEMKFLLRRDPQLCHDFLMPQLATQPINLQRLLPKQLIIEDQHALAEIILAFAAGPETPTLSPQVEADLEAIVARIVLNQPWAIEALQNINANVRVDPRVLCESMLLLYTQYIDLPTDQRRGAMLRYTMSQP